MLIRKIKNQVKNLGWKDLSSVNIDSTDLLNESSSHPNASFDLDGHEFCQQHVNEVKSDSYWQSIYVKSLNEPVTVEPQHGFIIYKNRFVLKDLMGVHKSVSSRAVPPLKFKYYKNKSVAVDEAILLRNHYGEDNYFHFFSDVCANIHLMSKYSELEDLPIIVSKKQFEQTCFQYLKDLVGLKNRTWIIQHDQRIVCKRLWLIKARSLSPDWLRSIQQLFNVYRESNDYTQRLLIIRNTSRRPLRNRQEVIDFCKRYDFRPVDPGSLSINEQRTIFSGARYIIAEHGAACTNILFKKGGPLTLLELFPEKYISTCYYVICRLSGFKHILLRGQSSDGDIHSYTINIEALEKKIKHMLSE